MAKHVTEIVLDIEWDDDVHDHPSMWNWTTLLDVGDPEEVKVIRHEELSTHEAHDHGFNDPEIVQYYTEIGGG